ncbi:SDR family NAD(P)-dependent oxidoreductase [Paludibacterium yongneupense]|uniref:SDR family NAD(P)-dependent oxidoreductase n=1 Tax=Paludibacterium yongneupense TaxID=400061 RepID=UPI0004207B21|nr:SDR family oxidoreductase [Paludibacterium yongneupense]
MKSGKWAVVSGASSGLGVDFSRQLAAQGYRLVLVARSEAPMRELADELARKYGSDVRVFPLDLAAAGAVRALSLGLAEQGIEPELLVNNAGFGLYGDFSEQPLERIRSMLQLNIIALTELTHVLAAGMKARGRGQILLVASIGGYQATPGYAAYCASKAYVLLFGEALHNELGAFGVNVTVVSPGVTATRFLQVAGQQPTR